MKKWLCALLLLAALAAPSYGQGFSFVKYVTFTLDSLTDSLYFDTTFVVNLKGQSNFWFGGKAWAEVVWDSIAGGIADSSRLRVRRGYGPEAATSVMIASDGAAMDWQPTKIYDGGTTFTDWTLSYPMTDLDRFDVYWEMGGQPWEYAIFHLEVYDSTAAADGKGKFYLNFYKW